MNNLIKSSKQSKYDIWRLELAREVGSKVDKPYSLYELISLPIRTGRDAEKQYNYFKKL